MSDDVPGDMRPMIDKSLDAIPDNLAKLMIAAQPGAVFGTPVQSGAYTIITASEVRSGGGFGTGVGYGTGTAAQPDAQNSDGGGGGGGGGGAAVSRPVAVISIGPDGVTVKPILDATRLGLALITAWGAMLLSIGRMRRFGKR